LGRKRKGEAFMTFFEWIRQCLLADAREHPFPKRFDGATGAFVPKETDPPPASAPEERGS
jgi:hypothetical protein